MHIKAPNPRGLLAARLFTQSSGHMGKNQKQKEPLDSFGWIKLSYGFGRSTPLGLVQTQRSMRSPLRTPRGRFVMHYGHLWAQLSAHPPWYYRPPCTAWKECWQPHKSQASPADGRTWSLASYLTFHSLSKWRRTVSAMDHRSAALPCPPSRWKTPVHHQSSPKAHSVKLWHNSSCEPQWIIKVYLSQPA